jgi:Ca2+-binding EF-hand superfamily protein
VRAIEEALRVHMNAPAARYVALEFASIGVDTPDKLRRVLLGRSLGVVGLELLSVALNSTVAFAMYLLFRQIDAGVLFPGAAAPPVGAWETALRGVAVVGPFALGGVFAVEAFAHSVILAAMVANAFWFGFENLDAFSDAINHLARTGETNRDAGFNVSGAGFERLGRRAYASGTVPGATAARDAAAAVAVARKLASLRDVIRREVASVHLPEMDGVERLAALLELSAAEREGGFEPAEYDMSEEDAMRVAAVFAEFDRDSDGVVDEEELASLLSELGKRQKRSAEGAEEGAEVKATRAEESVDFEDERFARLAVDALDDDGDGAVSLEEFVRWYRGGCPLAERDEEKKTERDETDDMATVVAESIAFGE